MRRKVTLIDDETGEVISKTEISFTKQRGPWANILTWYDPQFKYPNEITFDATKYCEKKMND